MRNIHIGTAGFSYNDWLGNFYPQFCPAADYLRCYAMTFDTVEIDSTFYRIPTAETVLKWAKMTPEGFRFAAKFPRTVTHEGDRASRVAVAGEFVKAISKLGEKLGPLLMQFPASFKPDRRDLLAALLETCPAEQPLAVELRDPAWLEAGELVLLRERGIGLCLAEYPGMPRRVLRTSDLVYVRFVGDHREITEDFSWARRDCLEELAWWEDLAAGFAGENAEIYAYFNNHFSGHAPTTASKYRDNLMQRMNSRA